MRKPAYTFNRKGLKGRKVLYRYSRRGCVTGTVMLASRNLLGVVMDDGRRMVRHINSWEVLI